MKAVFISIVIALAFIGGAFLLANNKKEIIPSADVNNVSIVDGKQIIEITARGGYQPGKSVAKAGIPTVVRFKTNGTFDCSSSVRIASLGILRNLPQTGLVDIDIGSGEVGTLQGSCGMGMYPFEIDFEK